MDIAGFGVLGVVAIVVFFFLYARRPSVKHGGIFKKVVKRQRELRESTERDRDKKSGE